MSNRYLVNETKKQIGWEVWLFGKHINTVFYSADCDKDYVKRGLIDHDGFNFAIRVIKAS